MAQHVEQVDLDARRAELGAVHPAGDGHQLLVVVRDGLHLPVFRAEEELRVVEQVQLRDGGGVGYGDVGVFVVHFLYVAGECSFSSPSLLSLSPFSVSAVHAPMLDGFP